MTAKEKEKKERIEEEDFEEPFHKPRRKRRRGGGGVVWGLILLSLGVVFLLNNFGILPWSVWGSIWRLWPLILIFIAVEIIFGRTFIGRFIVSVLVLGVIGLIFVFAIFPRDNQVRRQLEFRFPNLSEISLSSFDSSERTTTTLRVGAEKYEDEKITKRTADFDLGSSSLDITDSDMPDFLIVDATYFEGVGEPVVESDLDDGVLELRFYTKDRKGFSIGTVGVRKYKATLGRTDIETELKINLGSGKVDVDLSELVLNSLGVDMGSGSVNVDLSSLSTPSETISIDMGSGSMNLRLPKGTGIKADYTMASGSLKIEGNSLSGKGIYTSSNYSSADNRVELDLKMGSGSVTISNN